MKTSARRFALAGVVPLALCGLLAACSSTPKVTQQSAPDVNIANYRTFSYISPLGTDRSGYTSFLSADLKKATQTALEAKGYSYTETSPAMLVNFSVSVQQKTQVEPMPAMPVGRFGFRAGLYGGWAGYGYPGTIDQYDEGTLMIDLVDPGKKQLIWEGSTKTISNDASKWTDEQIQTQVNAIIGALPQAGG